MATSWWSTSATGERTEWPFFDSLKSLIDYSLARLPYDGGARVKLPQELLCDISPKQGGCSAESLSIPAEVR